MSIRRLLAREIYDSRGRPTVEVDLFTDIGIFCASVPSGASVGLHEARELRDGVKVCVCEESHKIIESVRSGLGVLEAAANVEEVLEPELVGRDFKVTRQAAVDNFMRGVDGTHNKVNLGANAMTAVSMAVAKAGAVHRRLPLYRYFQRLAGLEEVVLPVPAFTLLNGGLHAGNQLAFQDFMILPVGATSFREAMRMGVEVHNWLKRELEQNIFEPLTTRLKTCDGSKAMRRQVPTRNGVTVHVAKYGFESTVVGDGGGFAPNLSEVREALNLLVDAVAACGYKDKVFFGIDCAASTFFKNGRYYLNFKSSKSDESRWLSSNELSDFYKDLIQDYSIAFLEDPFEESDFNAFADFTVCEHFEDSLQAETEIDVFCGDITASTPRRIRAAVQLQSGSGSVLKVNQVGTVSEAIEAARMTKAAGWRLMVSMRAGETEDTFLADFALGIKSGAPRGSEHLAKYNQLLRIEEELGLKAVFAGTRLLKGDSIGFVEEKSTSSPSGSL